MTARLRTALRRDDRGSSAVELLGALPVVVVVVLVLLQVAAFTFTVQAANQAVRDGARARSLGHAVPSAVEESLPGGLHAESIEYPSDGVRIEVRVPRIAVFPAMTVTRQAFMPRTVS